MKLRAYSSSSGATGKIFVRKSSSNNCYLGRDYSNNNPVNITSNGKGIWHSFTPNKSETYAILTIRNSGDPFIELYDSNFNLIGFNDDGNSNLNSRIVSTLLANRKYYIRARSYSTQATYSLTITKEMQAKKVDVGGNTSVYSFRYSIMQNDAFYIKFNPTYTGKCTFSVWSYTSGELDTHIMLLNSNFEYIDGNDDHKVGTRDSYFEKNLTANTTYYLLVQLHSHTSSGVIEGRIYFNA